MSREQRNESRKSEGLPHPDSLRRPSTSEEAEKMAYLGKKMISLSLQWAEEESRLSPADAGVLQGILSTILSTIMTKIKVLPYKEEMEFRQWKSTQTLNLSFTGKRKGGKDKQA